MPRRYRRRKPRKNKKSRFLPTKPAPSYGNPPRKSLVGKDAGECKEGMEPCYNIGCDRCRQDFEARKPSIEERILVFNYSDTWNQMYSFIQDGETSHIEKTLARSFISHINICINNYRLFHEKDVRTFSKSSLPHTEETARMEITPCVSHALRLQQMYSIISRR